MGNIEAILFWMGGVVTQSIPEILSNTIRETGQKAGNLYTLPGFSHAMEQFILGQLDDLSFCRQIAEILKLKNDPTTLRQKILDAFMANELALEVIQKLPVYYQRWVVVDLPCAWYEQIASRLDLPLYFYSNKQIFLPSSQLQQLVPDLFYYLSQSVQLAANHCLLIDPSIKRAIQGINQGFPSAHYINPQLLEREFNLRGFIGKMKVHNKPYFSL
jgi:hypothetical protein